MQKLRDYRPQLTKSIVQQGHFARNLTKVIFVELRDNNSSHDNMKKKLRLQKFMIDLDKQGKKQTKQNIRLAVNSVRIGVIAKTIDEIYVLSTIKKYSYFSFIFSNLSKKVELLKILKVM